jgi:hypothetical protein
MEAGLHESRSALEELVRDIEAGNQVATPDAAFRTEFYQQARRGNLGV